MRPVHFDGVNTVYTAPDGMPECAPLPVLVEDGWITSVWEIEDEERQAALKLLASGKPLCIRVTIAAQVQPVISLAIGTPADGKQTTPSQN